MKIFYSSKCLEYSQIGHPESPARVRATHHFLKEKGFDFSELDPCNDEDILLAHSQVLLESVKKRDFFDPDTPVFPGIFEIAKLSAGGAVAAALHCLNTNELAFSLMRPPGHHATQNALGGFCYFNNIAIACLKAQKEMDRVKKIAIVDFDCHHGNGTEDIMLGKKDVLYISLHQSPLYPGTGLKSRDNCINLPLPALTSSARYLSILGDAIKEVERFGPDLLAISAGFDAYKLDPIAGLALEQETFSEIGKMLSGLNRPTFAVLEGGYSRDLPECVYHFLSGLEK